MKIKRWEDIEAWQLAHELSKARKRLKRDCKRITYVTAQVVRFTVQRFKGWKRKRSIFMLFQLLNREPLNREPE